MEGKTFTFQVKVSPYNFTAQHQTFTITRILSRHEAPPVPDFVATVRTVLLYTYLCLCWNVYKFIIVSGRKRWWWCGPARWWWQHSSWWEWREQCWRRGVCWYEPSWCCIEEERPSSQQRIQESTCCLGCAAYYLCFQHLCFVHVFNLNVIVFAFLCFEFVCFQTLLSSLSW